MPESVLRLRVHNKEYDDGIKSSIKGLKSLTNAIYEESGNLDHATKSQVEYVRAIGKMETESSSAKGALRELTKAYKELQYQMQETKGANRDSDLFKAMQQAAQDLKPRIEAAKKEVEAIGKEANKTSGSFGQLANALGINTKTLVGWGAAIGAGKLAIDGFNKVVFDGSQTVGDTFRNAIAAANTVFDNFAYAIASADFSAFHNGLDVMIQKAREAAEELDKLWNAQQSFGFVQDKWGSLFNKSMTVLRDKNASTEDKAKAKESAEYALKQMEDAGKVVQARLLLAVKKQIASRSRMNAKDVTIKDIEDAIQADATFGSDISRAKAKKAMDARPNALNYQSESNSKNYRSLSYSKMTWDDSKNGGYKGYKKDEEEWYQNNKPGIVMNALLDVMSDEQYADVVQQMGQVHRVGAMNEQLQRQLNRATQSEGGGSHGGGPKKEEAPVAGSIGEQEKLVSDLQKAWKDAATDDSRTAIKQQLDEANKTLEQMMGKGKVEVVSTESLTNLQILQDQLKTVEESMKGYAKGSDDWKAMNEEAKSLTAQIEQLNGVAASRALAEMVKSLENELDIAISDLDLASKLDDSMRTSEVLEQQLAYWQEYFDNLKGLYAVDSEEYKAAEDGKASKTRELTGEIAVAKKKEKEKEKESDVAENAKKVQAAYGAATSAVGNLGAALQSIEDPTAKVAGIIASAIASIAQSFAFSLKGSATPWDWIAGATAGIATMISTISAIKSATEYHAEGGFVGGPKGTDVTPVWATPGELILNQAQQSNVANALSQSSAIQINAGEFKVKGSTMYGQLYNYMKESGKRLPA